MKYIRTENGVYEVKKEEIVCGVKFYDYETEEYLNRIREEHIIAQADTIEELCDGFYNDILNDFDCFGFDELYIYHDFESFKDDWNAYRTYDNWKGNGYGFIKTYEGLIYVAKMNEEGALVLR